MKQNEMESSPRHHHDTPARSRSGTWIVISLALLVLYVLSIGPVAWIDSRFPLGDDLWSVLMVFYYPLVLLNESEVPVLAPALQWYVELFVA